MIIKCQASKKLPIPNVKQSSMWFSAEMTMELPETADYQLVTEKMDDLFSTVLDNVEKQIELQVERAAIKAAKTAPPEEKWVPARKMVPINASPKEKPRASL